MVVNIRKTVAKETAKEGNEIGEMLKFECGQWKVSLKMTIRQITTMGEKVDFFFFFVE